MRLQTVARWMCLLTLCTATSVVHADRVDDYIRFEMQKRLIPGLSLAIVRDGKVIKAKGYGFANLELRVPATADTVYQLASVTKQFTATAIMLLAQDGKLSVDDRISRYIDGTPDAWKDITLRHLLTHTSGLKDYLDESPDSPEWSARSRADTTPEKIVQSLARLPLSSRPGEKFAYSNTNYLVLSMAVRRISGKSYDQFLAERVFKPLEMTATRLTSPDDMIPNRAAGYTWSGDKWRNSVWLNPTLWDNGDGGMLSSVLDLAKWDAALYKDAILTAASKQQMWTPVKLSDGKTWNYGFGWATDHVQGRPRIWHNGGRPGTSTAFVRFVEDKLTVIVLANRDNCSAIDIADRLAGFYIPALAPPVYKPIRDAEPPITMQVRTIMEGIAQGNLLPPGIPVNVIGFVAPIHNGNDVAANLHNLGTVRSVVLVERKDAGNSRLYRYRVAYSKFSVLAGWWFDSSNKIVRASFQLE
jgi:CubicO group peptidase (beta-lactamase class C family)